MSMKLVYTDEAINDLKRLREFIQEHNPIAAGQVATLLVQKIQLLRDFPRLGTPVDMAPDPDSIRDIIFEHYIIRYSVHASTIIILRIWHELENARTHKPA